MRKFNFLIGTLGGALGGFLMSNKNLRKRLKEAKDTNEAAKILGVELQRSGKEVAREAKEFLGREDVQQKLSDWQDYFSKEGGKLKVKAGSVAKKAATHMSLEGKKWAKQAQQKSFATYKRARKAVVGKLG